MSAQDDVRGKFRITTNGLRYRVEKRVKERWEVVGQFDLLYGFKPLEYTNVVLARNRMRDLIAEAEAEEHGWQPVEDAT